MTAVVCIDSGRGMSFFGRRQSTDGAVRERILSLAGGKALSMSEYSAAQFRGCVAEIRISSDPAPYDGVYFFEEEDPAPYAEYADRVVIYRWNRNYPRDMTMTLDPFREGMRLESICDFSGTSHDRITEEVWVRPGRTE